jgi:hypothetical protein
MIWWMKFTGVLLADSDMVALLLGSGRKDAAL